ncbi:MAG TPA: FGGY family carbohydrate kinase [Acidimicrobiales bacterium]|nr:FGGY family carbohydrate kinase [Acidimicrobiales bacterium]
MGITARFLLGLDVGTTRTKAVLLDRAGAEVGSAARPTPFEERRTGVEAEVDALLATVAAVVGDLGDAVAQVTAVGIAGLAESGAPLDAGGRVLATVIAWHDPRGAEAVSLLHDRFGDDLDRRVGQRLRTVSSVAKVGWLAANGVGDVRWWLGVPELCLHRLTDVRATDWSLAARTGGYDVGRRKAMPEVPEALGLAGDVFAEPAPAGAAMGTVTPAGSAWLGVPVGVPVTVAGHDHLAGAVGAGAGVGDLANSVGTAETVVGRSVRLPDVGAALDRGVAVSLWPDGDGWAAIASAARAGLVIGAAARALGRTPAELDDLAHEAGDAVDAAAWVEAMARAARHQGREPEAGDPPGGAPAAVWNGVLRALAARTREAAHGVEDVCGPARRMLVFGGGSRSVPWLRAKAAEAGVPVVRSSVAEAVARGAAVFAGVAAGWWPSAAHAPRPPVSGPAPPGTPGR